MPDPTRVTRRELLAAGAAAYAAGRLRGAERPPNLVLIVADDLGYGELGCYGGTTVPTPNLDALALGGVRCTDGYVSCPVCSPTRAGLITGRYQTRFGHEFNPGPPEAAAPNFGLPADQLTIAERLRELGYTTGLVGKWHLGHRPGTQPLDRGFDEFYGFLGGAHRYVPEGTGGQGDLIRGREVIARPEYLTDALGAESAAFCDRHRDRPFFLALSFNAVHTPLQATGRYLDRFAHLADTKRRTFAAMLSAMDDAVGVVLRTLRERGLDERTLIIFHSDNGGPTPQTTSGNGPLRGNKGSLWEGGIRVPFMLRWTGRLPAGAVETRPLIALDDHVTLLRAAGGRPPAGLDGVDLVPYLTGADTGRPHASLYWRNGANWAIRGGDWKLVRQGDGEPALFDLATDLGEARDLAADQPERAAALRADWDAWNAQNIDPLWRTGGQGG